MVNMVEIMK